LFLIKNIFDCLFLIYTLLLMAKFFLFMLAAIFSLVGLKLITIKSGNHDADFFLKLIGLILLLPSTYIILETLKIIK